MDKRSAVSSGRPVSTVAQKLVGSDDHLLTMDYGPKWREMRKLIQQEVTAAVSESEYVKLQEAEAVQMLRDFVEAPDRVLEHPKRFSNMYGTRTPSIDTPHMTPLYDLLLHFQKVMELGATPPVDFFPFLKWIPERYLGRWVTRGNNVGRQMNSLYGDVLRATTRGEISLGATGGVALEGGSETTAENLASFVKAMIYFPDAQKHAQVQIDAVIGDDVSPGWRDREKLPGNTSLNLSKKRCGGDQSLVWMCHMLSPKDESRFPDPEKFDPGRYAGRTLPANEYAVSSDYESRDHYNYDQPLGAGRRICPGIHLAERNMFITVAKLLWAFSFEKKIDESGNTLEPDINYETGFEEGLVICSKPFPSEIKPRSQKRVETIMRGFEQAERERFPKYAWRWESRTMYEPAGFHNISPVAAI